MEALWSFDHKWSPSTKQAFFLLLLLFAASGSATVIAATFLRRLKSRKASPSPSPSPPPQKHSLIASVSEECSPDAACGWVTMKAVLAGWRRPGRWGGGSSSSSGSSSSGGGSSTWGETPLPLMEKRGRASDAGWAVESPVWQRPILMGGKCELPRFSGLILYDENGQPCDHVARRDSPCTTNLPFTQVKSTPKAVRITLRDLL